MRSMTACILLGLALSAWSRPNFSLPVPEKFKLSNGVTVYYLQDHSLPLLGFRLVIDGAGLAAEPKNLEGSADLMAELMMKGAAGKSALQVAEALDFTGAQLQISAAEEYLGLSGQVLADHWPALLQLACDCLLRPTFSDSEFTKEVERRIDQIKAIKDEPSSAVRYYFRKNYFNQHPFGHLDIGNETALQAVRVHDIRTLYDRVVRPEKTILAVVGDFKPAELRALLQKQLAGWKAKTPAAGKTAIPELPVPPSRQCLLIDKPDATQAYFVLGAPGLAMGDETTAPSQVMNTLFGGRFTSWLNSELRIKRGLTYGARSGLEFWKNGGIFTISSYTKNDKIGEMLQITFDLMDQAVKSGFSDEQTTSSRNYVLGQFPPRFETLSSKARAFTDLVFYGLPFDYYAGYLARVAASATASVNRQAGRLMPRDRYVLVVVGKADEIRKQLEPYGTWQIRSITESGF